MKGRGNPHLFTPLLKGMSQGLPPLCYYEKDATLLLPVIARVPKGLLSLSCKEGGNPDDAILHSLVIARSAPSFCHCEEGRSPDEAISLRGFLTLGCPPCPSLRVRTEVLPKQSLFVSTIGSTIQLHPNYRRSPRATLWPSQ